MSTSEFNFQQADTFQPIVGPTPAAQPERRALHRIREVRREQEMSLRRAAQHMHRDMEELRREEEAEHDLPLSRLYAWQKVLEVPIADLLVDTGAPLSAPVLQRARLVRLMKTAAAIQEKAASPSIKRLTQTLIDQLKEIMPELEGVTAWNSVGRRRTSQDIGRAGREGWTFGYHD